MKTMTRETEPVHINEYDGVQQEYERFVDLRGQLGEAERRIDRLLSESSERRDVIADQAQALVDGVPYQETPETNPELSQAYASKRVLAKACELQERKLIAAQQNASRKIAEAVKPAHDELVREVCRCLAALSKATESETRFRDDLQARGIQFSGVLRPMPVPGSPGFLRDSWSNVNAFLKEAEQYGFITAQEKERLAATGEL